MLFIIIKTVAHKVKLLSQSFIFVISLRCCTLLSGLLLNNLEHLLLDLLLFYSQPILLPNKFWLFGAETISLHAALEETNDVTIVGILGEAEASAVVHELLEFVWLISAELLNGYLLLLFLNISVFFLLRSTSKSLPWKGPLEEIE